MIQANELRIGNWVKRYDGVDIQVSNIGKVGLGLDIGPKGMPIYLEWSKFEPIPLTPEILEKCGFEKERDTYKKINNNLSYLFRISWTGGGWFSSNVTANIPTLYLHQLQNLYFALTGEELNYKP